MVDIFTKTAASAVLKPKFVNQFLAMQEASVGSFDFRKIKFENQDVREKKKFLTKIYSSFSWPILHTYHCVKEASNHNQKKPK